MFLYINIELVDKQPIKKCLTLSYYKMTKMLLSLYTIVNKNAILPTKGLMMKIQVITKNQ